MLKIVVLTGAGISADSGIPTYRSSDGLWANYKIEEVCTPEALANDREKVINFYNMRRKEMAGKQPNAGHKALAELEKYFDVEIVTQNIDNLHEAAGSTKITHLHGELTKLRNDARDLVKEADMLIIVGTSLAVYPAASLVGWVKNNDVPIYVVDPSVPKIPFLSNKIFHKKERAAIGLPKLVAQLKEFAEIQKL